MLVAVKNRAGVRMVAWYNFSMSDKPKIFSFKPQSQWGKAVGLGLALHGAVGGAVHGVSKAHERIERYEHRRDHDARHERFQEARRQLIEQALVELQEGRYRSGRFIIRANALDLREAGFFPETTTVEEIEAKYQRILTRFQSRLSQYTRPYTLEQISEALVDATGEFDYQGVAGSEMLLLLVEGTGSCDQIAQFVASLLHDAGVGEAGLRAYTNHTAPTLLVRTGAEVREFDMSGGGPVYPYGVAISLRNMPILYRHHHFSGPSTVDGLAGVWSRWSAVRHPADTSGRVRTDIIDVGSFRYPSPSPEMDRPFPSDAIPFYASNIVSLYTSGDNGTPRPRVSHHEESSFESEQDAASSRQYALRASTEVIFAKYIQTVLQLGQVSEQDGYQAIDVFQPFSRREMQLLSQHLDRLALEVQRAPNERERIAWQVELAVVYRMAALQSQVLGRRQAQTLAQLRIDQLIEQVRPFFAARSLTEQVEFMRHGSPPVAIEYVVELLPEYQQRWAEELLRIIAGRQGGSWSHNRIDTDRLLRMFARVMGSLASDRRMELLERTERLLNPFEFAEFVNVFDAMNTHYQNRATQSNEYHTQDWNVGEYLGHVETVGDSPLVGRLCWRRGFLSGQNMGRVAGYQNEMLVPGAYRTFDDVRSGIAEYALQNRLSVQESRWLLIDVITNIHARMLYGNIFSRMHNQMMIRSYNLLCQAVRDPSWSEWPEARGVRETLAADIRSFQSQLPAMRAAIRAESSH